MANEEIKRTQVASPMAGGDDSQSYAQNSTYQKAIVDSAKGLMSDAIRDKLDFNNLSNFDASTYTFTIVDLGCAAGPNTFFAINNIIEAVQENYNTLIQNPKKPLEFQVFFNDFIGNDFNNLFKTLPTYQKYYAAGVPGSFYTRLFPKKFIHFAHSSYSLHWLSKVPEELVDRSSPAWNKRSIYCSGSLKEVADVYLGQYKNDMNVFLNARAEEIVAEGLMVIIVGGRPDGVLMAQTSFGIIYEMFGSCLDEMAYLGLISEEKVESFNLPQYYASCEELKEIIEENGHFSIERIEEMKHSVMTTKPKVEMVVSGMKSVFGGVLKEHFGNEEIAKKMLQFVGSKVTENYLQIDEGIFKGLELFVMLKRKIN